VTLVSELGQLSRFEHPRQLMGYAGIVSREHSSGERVSRGSISKAGNAHLRRIVVEAAWSYRHRPAVGGALKARQVGASEIVTAIAWRAQHRLHERYRALMGRGKTEQKVITADIGSTRGERRKIPDQPGQFLNCREAHGIHTPAAFLFDSV